MTNEEQGVLDAVQAFLDSYSERNVQKCMSVISDAQPIVLFGTNQNEVFKTREEVRAAFKRDFDSMSDIRWGEHRQFHVRAVSTLASVLVELPTSFQVDGKRTETLFRYALTLIREGEEWKICCGMASVPFAEGTYTFSE